MAEGTIKISLTLPLRTRGMDGLMKSAMLDRDVPGRLEGRPIPGCIGIGVHGTAGLFDPGWAGKEG